MSEPNPTGAFGSQQFQKTQFGHKPHEEIRTDSPEEEIKKRVGKPAGWLKIISLLSLAVLFIAMAFQLINLSIHRQAWITYWNNISTESIRANAPRRRGSSGVSDEEEKAIKRAQTWNKNRYTLWMGFVVVSYFVQMCFLAFIAVSAHKMANLKGYRQSWVASILAVIPCTGPLVILGIPFGIWAMLVLNDSNVKNAFKVHGG